MKAYRIGKIEGPWTNLEPPIRSKILSVATTDKEKDVEKDVQDVQPTQNAANVLSSGGECNRRACWESKEEADYDIKKTRTYENLTREEYTLEMEQKEIADGINEFPSLDADTQHEITLEYRAMHERVKELGLYECRYSEYGKELIRYSILFAIFIFFLQAKWYLTSAVFLGMFWVRMRTPVHDLAAY